jgi:hypothetical protein
MPDRCGRRCCQRFGGGNPEAHTGGSALVGTAASARTTIEESAATGLRIDLRSRLDSTGELLGCRTAGSNLRPGESAVRRIGRGSLIFRQLLSKPAPSAATCSGLECHDVVTALADEIGFHMDGPRFVLNWGAPTHRLRGRLTTSSERRAARLDLGRCALLSGARDCVADFRDVQRELGGKARGALFA